MAKELCEMPTAKGPCTMPKGHDLPYHRHREYEHSFWQIKDEKGKLLASGENMVPMNTAIGRLRKTYDKLFIAVEIG